MLSYVPLFLRESQIYQAIINPQGIELDLLSENTQDVLRQFFVETATWGLVFWESELGIKTITGKTYDERRSNIIAKIRGIGNITIALIKSVAESYAYGTVSVTKAPNVQSFAVKFISDRGIPSNLDDIKAAIEDIKPAHLEVNYEFIYLTWDELGGKTLNWDALDASALDWDAFEAGGW